MPTFMQRSRTNSPPFLSLSNYNVLFVSLLSRLVAVVCMGWGALFIVIGGLVRQYEMSIIIE